MTQSGIESDIWTLNGVAVTRQMLTLKQTSTVLQVDPKELQNLFQFGVVKPRRTEGTYFFDPNALLVAKIPSCLKGRCARARVCLPR